MRSQQISRFLLPLVATLLLLVAAGCTKDDATAAADWVIDVTANPASFQIVDPDNPPTTTVRAVVYNDIGKVQSGIGVRFSTEAGSLASGGRVLKTNSRGEAEDTLTVLDTTTVVVKSGSAEGKVDVTVGSQNEAPTASISISPRTNTRIGTTTQFSGSQSEDPDGNVERYIWILSYGLGRVPAELTRPSFCVTTADPGTEICDTVQSAFTRTFTEGSHIELTLEVVDDLGKKSAKTSSSYDIVPNSGPTADLGPSPQAGTKTIVGTNYFCSITLSACGSSDSDATQGGRIVTYEFSWGDGVEEANTCQRQHTYRAPGEYIVHLTVFDNGIGDGDGDGDASATDFDDPCNQTPPNFSCPNILTDETDALDGSSSQPKDVKVVCPA
ncbi:MAG: PKD domain-containing protein [Acidobacteriota bacterium]